MNFKFQPFKISMYELELGLDLSPRQYKLVTDLITKFELNIDSMTYSSGRSLIFYKPKSVYQLYLSDELFNKVIYNINLCNNIEGVVKYYNIYPTLNTIEYERVEPIYNITTNRINVNSTFYSDIYTILESFLNHHLVHGDFCCDNIGYSHAQQKYVVYDLETVRYMTNEDDYIDKHRFEKSLNFCTFK